MEATERKPWQWHVERADHYAAIEQKRVSLWDQSNDVLPWEYVTGVDAGGMMRLGTSVSASFEAKHPCGLRFSWSLDFEGRGANGSSTFQAETGWLTVALTRLPPAMRDLLAEHLHTFVVAVRQQAKDYRAEADRQERAADAISALVLSTATSLAAR